MPKGKPKALNVLLSKPSMPMKGIWNGILLSIPLWGVIIFGIIAIKGAINHG